MWSAIQKSILILVPVLMGCSGPQTPTASDASPRIHLPRSLAQLAQPATNLQDLSPNLVDKTIHVEGEVQQQAPLLDSWLYQVADETASIWIATATPPPAIGASVRIQGVVRYQQIQIASNDISEYYLQEAARTVRNQAEEPEREESASEGTEVGE
ncbi:MAG: hypothetical protein AAFY20_12190 [Cyanobacteria bacterium J06639_14]